MVAYWRGLPANKDGWLRVDVERHFEGIPRQEIRDYVAVKRRGPSEKTLNFVKNQSMQTVLHSHDLDDAKVLEQHVKPVVHAIVDQPQILAQTPKQAGPQWYDGLLSLAPMAGSLVGEVVGAFASKNPIGAEIGGAIGGAFGTGVQQLVGP